MYVCQVCQKEIDDKKHISIKCTGKACGRWTHITCAGISSKKVNEVAPTFQCIRCKGSLTSTDQLSPGVNRERTPYHRADMEKLERLLLELKNEVTELKRDLKN